MPDIHGLSSFERQLTTHSDMSHYYLLYSICMQHDDPQMRCNHTLQ